MRRLYSIANLILNFICVHFPSVEKSDFYRRWVKEAPFAPKDQAQARVKCHPSGAKSVCRFLVPNSVADP